MVEVYHTTLPGWAVLIAAIVPGFYMIPCGIIQGITNVDANQLNVLSEFVGGYIFNGRPLANMIFKILSTDVVGQGLYFAADMKLGHYMKIPPRTLFFAQGSATILGALTQTGVTLWMLGNVKDICSSDQSNGFTCPNGRTVFSSSIIWGAIGPGRVYSLGKIYSGLLHFFWLGAVVPVITWALWKYWKKADGSRRNWLRLTNWPLIFVGTYNVPPATGINYSSWALVNVIFNWWIKSKFFAWWGKCLHSLWGKEVLTFRVAKYNYVLAAGLDTGLAISALVIFFCITYPGGVFPDWWGKCFCFHLTKLC
jgi:OPT family oligopeptide transporter